VVTGCNSKSETAAAPCSAFPKSDAVALLGTKELVPVPFDKVVASADTTTPAGRAQIESVAKSMCFYAESEQSAATGPGAAYRRGCHHPAVTTDDTEALRALIATIERTFGHDVDEWLTVFDTPFVVVAESTMVLPSADVARERFGAMFAALVGRSFASTKADDVEVRVVADDLALVDATFTRRRADGSELERLATLYVCRRRPDGWRVGALIPHPPGTHVL
jgi:hypothetical protein